MFFFQSRNPGESRECFSPKLHPGVEYGIVSTPGRIEELEVSHNYNIRYMDGLFYCHNLFLCDVELYF